MPRKIKFNPESIEAGLKLTSTTSERVTAFQSAGLPTYAIADALGVPDSTLNNWTSAGVRPRAQTLRSIDDIRYAFTILTDGGLPYERAAMVLRSRNDLPPYHRPMEIIAEQPLTVFEIAHHAVEAWANKSAEATD